MRKNLFVVQAAVLLLTTGTLFAGSLDYLGNQSAVYLQTLNRNAATEGADIVNYNPAGTAFLPEGLHLDLSNQFLFKLYEHTSKARYTNAIESSLGANLKEDTLRPEIFTPFLPNLYASYNFGRLGPGRLAANFQAGVVAGGGELVYDSGTAGTTYALYGTRASLLSIDPTLGAINSQSFTASSIYYNVALGGAYSFLDDMIAVSAGARLVIPRRSFTLKAEFANGATGEADVTYNALGVTPIIGFDIRPVTGLTVGLRYEVETSLRFTYDVRTSAAGASKTALEGALPTVLAGAGVVNGRKFNQNLPHIIAAGVEYEVIPGLAVDMSGAVYLLPIANYAIGANKTAGDYFGTGFDLGLGATWKLTDAVRVGAGFSYTESGTKGSYYTDQILNASANPPLDSVAFALGGAYSLGFGLDINLGFLYCHYLPVDYAATLSDPAAGGVFGSVSGTNRKDVINIGIGVSYHF